MHLSCKICATSGPFATRAIPYPLVLQNWRFYCLEITASIVPLGRYESWTWVRFVVRDMLPQRLYPSLTTV